MGKEDKKEKKDKESKDGKKDKEKKENKSKDKERSSKGDKPEKKEKKVSKDKQPEAGPSRPPPRKLKQPLPEPSNNDYLAGMDLPSSDEEEEEREVVEREEKVLDLQITHKEAKKIADKERRAKERALALKREALTNDENVFDVAYEGMGNDRTAADENATDVKVHNLTVRAKGKLLLEKTEVTIVAGRRYGLAGPNGKGKSTLLRLLASRQIPVPESIDVMLVEQEVQADDRSALEAVVQADFRLVELRERAHVLEEKMKDENLPEDDAAEAGEELNEVYEELEEAGNSTAEARASRILYGLGFDDKMRARSTKSFSGGWRMRISLARALYLAPTLLLLDEPTNHLDLRAVLWLEEYLCRYKKTLVVVSHDRGFLNEVTTDIIHLHDEQLHYYRGNFASFEEMYEQRRRAQNKEFEKYEKSMKSATQGSNKEKQREAAKKIERNQAKAQQKGAGKKGNKGWVEDDDTNEATAKPRKWNDYNVNFKFPEPTELPTTQLLQLIDADFKYPGRDDFGMFNMNIGIGMGSRICIVGPNGAGKSTLMNLLAGDLEPTSGDARKSIKLRVGRYAQHFVDALEMDDTPVEYLMRTYGHMRKADDTELKEYDVRAMLGKFGLAGHHHHQPIVKLSGGQKARVVFVAIALSQPHILLLDEPTNHLDMQSIDALCEAVTSFGGGVVVISHDSTLLDALCSDEERSEVWIVENGTVKKWHSDFAEYRDSLINEIKIELDEDERNFRQAKDEPVLLQLG